MATKKPRKVNPPELLKSQNAKETRTNYSIFRFISNLITNLNIGGNMSEQGADKAGLTISEGVRFFLKSVGIGLFLPLPFYFLPYLAESIITLKNI